MASDAFVIAGILHGGEGNGKEMIDTHLHILPGVDDGPQTLQESLTLARVLVQEGVRVAVATPHYNDEYPQRPAREILERVQALQFELDRNAIPLRLLAGHEVLIKAGMVEDIMAGRLATLNGSRYVLLELWNDSWLPDTERVIFELLAHGFIPLLAHPERYRVVQRDPGRLATLIHRGVLAQLTASSLVGMQGQSARRCAETLLKKRLIQCIASDAHGMHRRPPGIVEGLRCARQIVGPERVSAMVEEQPSALLSNAVVVV